MGEIELKPCPFCGGSNVRTFGPVGWYRTWGISHSCKSFYSGTSEIFQGFQSEAGAVSAWNTRVDEAALSAVTAELEELRNEYEQTLNDRDAEISASFDAGHYRAMSEYGTPQRLRAEVAEARLAEIEKGGAVVKALDPDMPAEELRLHMGALSAPEVRISRAAIRWANSRLTHPLPAPVPDEDVERMREALEPNALAHIVANIRQGESSTPRCEPPGVAEVDIAQGWVVRVLRAIELRRAALAQREKQS